MRSSLIARRSPPTFEARIRRAKDLASRYPFASEALQFYERLAGCQQELYNDFDAHRVTEKGTHLPESLWPKLDLLILLPRAGSFLSCIEEFGPPPLAQSAGELRSVGRNRWQEALLESWRGGPDSCGHLTTAEALICRAFLQPYAEYLADHSEQPEVQETPHLCPLCSSQPQVGVLRQEGDGAKRSLICVLCSTEWDYRRIGCPSCGEENAQNLPVYIAEQFPHIRVEACDACHHYLKTIDLTKDGHAIAVVDELAAIPLSLWAEENGYTKLEPNLLGI